MPLPLVGAQAVLAGMPEFNKNADIMNSKIGGIHQKMGGLGTVAQKAGGLVSGAFKAMAIGTGAAVASIGAVGGGILKLAYDSAQLPGIESVFKNMTQSMGVDADALMGKMRAATYGAVKDFDLMKSANKAMVGAGEEFGKMFAESLPTLMTVSREAAKAQGLSVEYMYESIVTGVKRMSPMILDNLGFQLSLTEANEKYAQSIGKTSKELTKQEKQMALLQEVLRSGNQLIEQSGGHIDSIQKDVQSWQTALKNVKDRIGIELLPVLQKFMDIIGKPSQGMQDAIVKVASDFVDKLIPAIDNVALAISTLLQGPLAMLIRGLASVGLGGFKTLGESLGAIFSGKNIKFDDFSAVIEKMLTPMLGENLAEKLSLGAARIVDTLQSAFKPIRDIFQDLADSVQDKLDVIQGAFNVFIMGIQDYFGGDKAGGIQKMLMGLRAVIITVFGPEVYNVILKFVGYMKIAADFVIQHTDEIIGALKGVAAFLAGKTILDAFSGLSKVAGGAVGGIGKLMLGLLSPASLVMGGMVLFGAAWEKNWFGIRDKTAQVVDTIKKVIGGVGTELGGGMFDWNSILPPNLAEIMGSVSGVIVGIRDTIQGGDFPWEDVLPPDLASIAYSAVGAIDAVSAAIGPLLEHFRNAIGWLEQGDFVTALDTIAIGFGEIFGPDAYEVINSFGMTVYNVFTQIGVLVGNIFNTIVAVAEAVWPNIQTIIMTVWNAISEVFNVFLTTIWPALLAGFQGLLAWVNDNWPTIQSIIVGAFTFISGVIATVVSEVIPFAIAVFAGLVDWVKTNWPAIQETVAVVMEFIGGIIQSVLGAIQRFWDDHGRNVMSIIQLVWDWIKTTIGTAIGIIQGIISTIMAIIRGDWAAAWEGIKSIVNLAWEWIKKTVDTAIKLVGDIISAGWGLIKAAAEIIWDAIVSYVESAWDRIYDAVDLALTSVGTLIDTGLAAVEKAWNTMWNGLADIVKNVWNSVLDFLAKGLNGAIDLLNGLITSANKIPGVEIGLIGHVDVSPYKLAEGGILNRPTFVAGEAGAEVVAPLRNLMKMISASLESTIVDLTRNVDYPYSGPQPGIVNNYAGDTYVREYNLTTQSIVRPGTLAYEFAAMELAHA